MPPGPASERASSTPSPISEAARAGTPRARTAAHSSSAGIARSLSGVTHTASAARGSRMSSIRPQSLSASTPSSSTRRRAGK